MDSTLSELRDLLASAIQGLSPEDFQRHPEGKWSSAEIIDHLNLTYRGTIKNLERCLASGTSGAGSDPSSKRWRRRVIIWLGYFPPGRESPEHVRPRGIPIAQLTTEVFENLERMDSVIRQCDARFGAGMPIADHPILGPMSSSDWRKFHLVHGRHHVRQILRRKRSR